MRSADERKKLLKRLRISIECREREVYAALREDLGKGAAEAYTTEVGFVYAGLAYAEKHLAEWMEPERKRMPIWLFPASGEVRYEPYGRVLIIGPFNYPFQLVMEPLVGALAAGNDAVIKPSPLASATARVVADIIEDAFPRGEVKCVCGGAETAEQLIRGGFDHIFFTGGARTGRHIMRAAAETLTPVTLELGGKSPVIVCGDADIRTAAKRIMWGKCVNAGQTCVAPDYVLAEEGIKDRLIAELRSAAVEFYGENALESEDYGRIINRSHFERLEAIMEADGAYLVHGGARDSESLYIEPSIYDLSKAENPLLCAAMEQEIFGPILPVIPYKNEEEIFDLLARPNAARERSCNGSFNMTNDNLAQKNASLANPLALYIFTPDISKREAFMERISSGGVCINDTLLHLATEELPFGGVSSSGMGAYHGKESFLTFSHKRSIMTRSSRLATDIMFPPYGERKLSLIKRLLK